MAQRKRKSTTQGSNPPAEVKNETTVNGVLVALEGGARQIQTLGETRPLEVPTLLRQAAKDVERELGID